MSDKSPLFVSSMELIAHAVDLYTDGNERKYKFIILHLANAVELILKDRLIDAGVSIYEPKQNSKTIGIWTAFRLLDEKGINVPERPIIELLVDDRNTIQHRFGFPDSKSVYFYLEETGAFFMRFLNDEYALKLDEILSDYLTDKQLALLSSKNTFDSLDRLFSLSPEAAVLQAYNLVETRVSELLEVDATDKRRMVTIWRTPEFRELVNWMIEKNLLHSQAMQEFSSLRELRNRAAHTAHFSAEETSPGWLEALTLAKRFIVALEKADALGYMSDVADDDTTAES